jgi:ABC-type phosphate/phosphonate transport system substrate-binding protein
MTITKILIGFYSSCNKRNNLQVMLRIIILTGILSGVVNFGSYGQSDSKENEKRKPYRFIFSLNLFHNTKTEDAIALSKIFVEKIKKSKKIKVDVEIIVCETQKEIIDSSYKDFDFILTTTGELSKLLKTGNVKPVLVNETQKSFGFIYYLITNKDNHYKNLSDLKGGSIKILSRMEGQVPSIWLDKLLRDNGFPKENKFFNDITYDYKPTNVILPVFFNKISCAIVSKPSFELLCELNPQIKQQTEILLKSEPLLFGLLCFDTKNKDKEREKFIYDTLLNMHKYPDGIQFLDLFNVDRIVPYKEEYWQNYLNLYK